MNYHNFIDCLNVVAQHAYGGYQRQISLEGNDVYLCPEGESFICEDSITGRRLKELGAIIKRGNWVVEALYIKT